MTDLISTPLVFPKVEPTDWEAWWGLWKEKAKLVRKVVKNHNRSGAMWKGFHIYRAPGINLETNGYLSEYVDCSTLLPSVYQNLDKLPIEVKYIQVVSSLTVIPPHHDFATPELAVRSMLYDGNPAPTFYYEVNGRKVYQTLPENSNTWAYWDQKVRHGTDFDFEHQKILVMFYGPLKEDADLSVHASTYNEHVISI